MENLFQNIKNIILNILVFLFPLFFLPITQEFYATNKLYLLAFGGLILFLSSTFSFLFSKKLSWSSHSLDTPIFLLLITIALSTIITSPNKIQALLNPNFGLIMMISLSILYFYLSRREIKNLLLLQISSVILSLVTIFLFFQPFKNISLPVSFQFLKNPSFTPIGNQFDLAVFLGLFLIYGLIKIISDRKQIHNNEKTNKYFILNTLYLILLLLALSLTLYSLFKPIPADSNQLTPTLPPVRLSWYAAVEILKQPLTALFGVGVDNFSSVFTRVKDLAYNQNHLWQINSFAVSRSSLLHIFTETGLFGLLAFSLLVWQLIKASKKSDLSQKLIIYYLLFIILFFPPSLITWFLFFIVLSFSNSILSINHHQSEKKASLDLTQFPVLYLGFAIIFFLFIAGLTYLSIRSYLAEYYFKKGLDGVIKNNAKEVYDNTRQAIIFNPYIESFRINFSQINLLIANNIAQKINQNNDQQKNLSETDRQNISQAVQAAISEAKAAVTLNPQKAGNWENLANIYQQIITFAQGADIWTISAYQRAIVLDPQNPLYRLRLGGIYYSLGNYEDAGKIFEQAVFLKPDWPNAHYNLAWVDYKRGNYQRAVSEMENVLSLLNPKKEKADYEKAKNELEEFRKKLPKEEQSATDSGQPTQLNLPNPIPNKEPVINLPKEASPEAK